MSILITGGLGFLGLQTASALLRRGVVCEARSLQEVTNPRKAGPNLHQQERSRATLVRRLMCYDRVDTGARARR